MKYGNDGSISDKEPEVPPVIKITTVEGTVKYHTKKK